MLFRGVARVPEVPAGEERLLTAARAGDAAAFAALVRPHLDALVAFSARVGPGPDAAEDVVQDTLLRAWRHLDGFRGDAPFRTWLFSIAWRAARTEGARVTRAPLPAAELPEVQSPEPGPEERGVRADLAARAHGALHRLTPPQRAAILRVDWAGETLAEAARAMAIPLGTLKTHLFRGRRRLAQFVDPESVGGGGKER